MTVTGQALKNARQVKQRERQSVNQRQKQLHQAVKRQPAVEQAPHPRSHHQASQQQVPDQRRSAGSRLRPQREPEGSKENKKPPPADRGREGSRGGGRDRRRGQARRGTKCECDWAARTDPSLAPIPHRLAWQRGDRPAPQEAVPRCSSGRQGHASSECRRKHARSPPHGQTRPEPSAGLESNPRIPCTPNEGVISGRNMCLRKQEDATHARLHAPDAK